MQDCFESFMTECLHNRDIHTYLKRATDEGCTWKTSPRAGVLAHVAPLFRILARVATNGILPTTKTEKALEETDAHRSCNFSGMARGPWASTTVGLLKVLFQNYREVKTDAESRRRCFNKASHAECEAVMSVLVSLTDLEERPTRGPDPSPSTTPQVSPREGAVVAAGPDDSGVELPEIFQRLGKTKKDKTGSDEGAPAPKEDTGTPLEQKWNEVGFRRENVDSFAQAHVCMR